MDNSLHSQQFQTYQTYINILFKEFYADEEITEFAINNLGSFFYEKNGMWIEEKNEDVDLTTLNNLASFLASITNKTFENSQTDHTANLVFSTAVPFTNERFQIVSPPVSNCFSITMRKPNKVILPLENYYPLLNTSEVKANFNSKKQAYDELVNLYQEITEKEGNYLDFILEAVKKGLSIVICGGTGSGKTTFMKTIMQYIDTEERIITIEDSPELRFPNHKNVVSLFYESEKTLSKNIVTSQSLISATLRMKPDRIILAELRGRETYDFINAISTGHKGSITSCHASSVKEAKQRLLMMMKTNPFAQSYTTKELEKLIEDNIDVIITMEASNSRRFFKEVHFNIRKDDCI